MTTGKRSSIGGEERHVAQRAVQALRDVAVLTEGAFEPSRLAELVVQNTCSLLQCDSSGLYVCDEDDGLLHCLADNGPMRGTGLRSIAERRGVTWRAFTTGKPCVVNDYSSWEMSHPLALKSGVKSDVAVPLLIGSRVIGTLNARSYVPRMWQPYEVDLLALFAAQVSPTLQLVQLYATAERKRSESEALAKLVRAGATERSVERVLNLICEQAGHLLNGDYSGISLVGDDGTRGPEWSGRWGQRLPRWPNYGRGVGRGVITPSIRERRTIVRDDLDTALTAPSIHLGEGGKSAVATPLISRGRVRGGLFVAWRTRARPGAAAVGRSPRRICGDHRRQRRKLRPRARRAGNGGSAGQGTAARGHGPARRHHPVAVRRCAPARRCEARA